MYVTFSALANSTDSALNVNVYQLFYAKHINIDIGAE